MTLRLVDLTTGPARNVARSLRAISRAAGKIRMDGGRFQGSGPLGGAPTPNSVGRTRGDNGYFSRGTIRGLGNIGTMATMTGQNLLAMGRAGRRALGGMMSIASNFEQQMQDVRSIMGGLTDDQFEQLNARARELGATTKFTAKQAGDGMFFMAQAGQDFGQVMAGIEPTLTLAAAGSIQLGKASDIVTDILSAHKIESSQTARVTGILANSAASATTDILGLGSGFRSLGGIATQAGQHLEEQSAVLAILADNGIKASKAGIAYRGIIGSLSRQTGPAAEALGKIGIKKKNLADLSSMQDVLGLFSEKMSKLSGSKKRETLFTVFGRRQAPAFLALLNDFENGNKLAKVTAENYNSLGADARMAAERMDSTTGSMLEFKSAVEELALAFTDLSVPREFLDGLVGMARGFGEFIRDHPKLSGVMFKSAIALTAISTAMGIVSTVGGGMIQAFVLGHKTLTAFKSAMVTGSLLKTFSLGMLGVTAAIAGVAAIILVTRKKIDDLRASTRMLSEDVKKNIPATVDAQNDQQLLSRSQVLTKRLAREDRTIKKERADTSFMDEVFGNTVDTSARDSIKAELEATNREIERRKAQAASSEAASMLRSVKKKDVKDAKMGLRESLAEQGVSIGQKEFRELSDFVRSGKGSKDVGGVIRVEITKSGDVKLKEVKGDNPNVPIVATTGLAPAGG